MNDDMEYSLTEKVNRNSKENDHIMNDNDENNENHQIQEGDQGDQG
jgi:hypothetical protein